MPAPRDNIAKLHAYTPGEQPTWRDTADPVEPVIKLNTNENPYPPCDAVLDAFRQLPAEALRLYPPPTADRFRKAAGEAHCLTADHILATNGGDELLRLLITCFCSVSDDREKLSGSLPRSLPGPGGGGIGVTNPTYSLYPVLADIHGTTVTQVDREPDAFAPPSAEALAQQWNDAGCALAFFVNPHAPSGRWENLDYVEALADHFHGMLVIDEAYVNFAPADAVALIANRRDDVILLRSLSKGYSLAGLRFGYGIAHRDVIATLDKARDSYNTDILSQVAATAAITHRQEARKTWDAVVAARATLTDALRQRGFAVMDSHTNFVLATPPAGCKAEALYAALKQRNILIRYFSAPVLADRVRITVGTPEQNTQLLAAIDAILNQSSA